MLWESTFKINCNGQIKKMMYILKKYILKKTNGLIGKDYRYDIK